MSAFSRPCLFFPSIAATTLATPDAALRGEERSCRCCLRYGPNAPRVPGSIRRSAMKTRLVLAAAIVLSACASYSGYGLHPGSSTADDVRRTMGRPAVELEEPGGGRE